MATLTRHRPPPQRSLLDARGDEARRPSRRPAAPRVTREAQPLASRPARATLDDLVAGTWQALQVTHAAGCLVCGSELTPRFGSGPHPVAARCRSCGSELS
jgi:hypothetical protein